MKIVQKPTPNFSTRVGQKPTLIVIHGDAGTTDAGTVEWLASKKSAASYHYLVGRKGTVFQFVDEKLNAWHAGKSEFQGEKIGGSVNRFSIGVAFANNSTEAYRPIQYEVGGELVADICKRHGIKLDRITGHNIVSPGRKSDPWPHYDWVAFMGEVRKHMGEPDAD